MRSFTKRYLPIVAAVTLPSFIIPCHADIYAFVDSNGVRHISNVRDDPRYQLVMRTPTYRKPPPPPPATATADQTDWRVIRPTGTRQAGTWPPGSKPFGINETNRHRYAADIVLAAQQHQLDPALLQAVISAESAFNPTAVSPAGAMGLMQLMPATAQRFGVHDPYDPIANIQGGARYLRLLLNQFQNLNLALAAYNAGENAVIRYGLTIPPYQETQTYVSRVLKFYNHYQAMR